MSFKPACLAMAMLLFFALPLGWAIWELVRIRREIRGRRRDSGE